MKITYKKLLLVNCCKNVFQDLYSVTVCKILNYKMFISWSFGHMIVPGHHICFEKFLECLPLKRKNNKIKSFTWEEVIHNHV